MRGVSPGSAAVAELSELPPILTVDEAAVVLRVGRSALYEAIRRNQIPVLRVGRKIRISRDALIDATRPTDAGRDVV